MNVTQEGSNGLQFFSHHLPWVVADLYPAGLVTTGASEVHVTWPMEGNHLQIRNWRHRIDPMMMFMAILKTTPCWASTICQHCYSLYKFMWSHNNPLGWELLYLFMGKETKTRNIINLFKVTQGVMEPGFNLWLSDLKACFISTRLKAVSIYICGQHLDIKQTTHGPSSQMSGRGLWTHSPVMEIFCLILPWSSLRIMLNA